MAQASSTVLSPIPKEMRRSHWAAATTTSRHIQGYRLDRRKPLLLLPEPSRSHFTCSLSWIWKRKAPVTLPQECVFSTSQTALSFLLLHIWHLAQCPTRSRHFIKICWIELNQTELNCISAPLLGPTHPAPHSPLHIFVSLTPFYYFRSSFTVWLGGKVIQWKNLNSNPDSATLRQVMSCLWPYSLFLATECLRTLFQVLVTSLDVKWGAWVRWLFKVTHSSKCFELGLPPFLSSLLIFMALVDIFPNSVSPCLYLSSFLSTFLPCSSIPSPYTCLFPSFCFLPLS